MARILCVDDEPSVLSLKCAALETAGHSVTAAISASDALAQLRRGSFDAVITDWRLGDGTGQAVVEAAKQRATPVVVVSGYLAEAASLEPRADLYLEKPVHPRQLVEAIRGLTEKGPEKPR